MKVRIVKEVKRSDGLWRFACGDVFLNSELTLRKAVYFHILYAKTDAGLKKYTTAGSDLYQQCQNVSLRPNFYEF